ncbi:small integral membrane protein 8-like [Dendronephthya gigantea]|uniref:small integral membrane protein 8-like n=1 Tax=Dendronephthya gigantea TaxID=151771 RepID=UPI00106AF469|nr:small integral membrane protein 8-like [Dendronephthya gigantea]
MADKKKIPNAEDKVAQNILTRGTLASRMINPELFIRPNKVVMGVGLIMLTGCVICLAYMNSDQKPVHVQTKPVKSESRKRSKWD